MPAARLPSSVGWTRMARARRRPHLVSPAWSSRRRTSRMNSVRMGMFARASEGLKKTRRWLSFMQSSSSMPSGP